MLARDHNLCAAIQQQQTGPIAGLVCLVRAQLPDIPV